MIQALYAHMNNKTIKKKRILIYTKAKKKNWDTIDEYLALKTIIYLLADSSNSYYCMHLRF
jgi:hypothetical protein